MVEFMSLLRWYVRTYQTHERISSLGSQGLMHPHTYVCTPVADLRIFGGFQLLVIEGLLGV